jgi:MOSC domain-containing protein YiiM
LRLALVVAPGEYDLGDSAATVRTVGRRWRWITEGLQDVPGAAVVAMEAIADVLEAAGGEGSSLDELSDAVWRRLDELAAARGARTKVIDALGEHHPLLIATEECDRMLSAAARAVVAEVGHDDQGYLERIHVSDGGAPKTSVSSAEVGSRGLSGDRQATRAHHGRPFQAVSLYSAELIDALAVEGHPIEPGAVGENLLLSGIDWGELRPGVRLLVTPPHDRAALVEVPPEPVVLELSAWAPPCKTIAPAFTDRRFDRMDHDKHPGWARAFAWVLKGGTAHAGSRVTVLP